MANPIIKIKRGSTTPATLSAGELAVDLTNLNLFVGKADGSVLTVGGSGTFATKAYTDNAVATLGSSGGAALTQEIADRQAADTTLQNNIDTAPLVIIASPASASIKVPPCACLLPPIKPPLA